MLPASILLENCCFIAFSDMEYISSGKLLNWIVCGIKLSMLQGNSKKKMAKPNKF